MKLFKFLLIMQEVSNVNRNPRLGKGFDTAHRFNKYNPLSYVVLILIILVGTILYGIVGFWTRSKITNPFNWD